MERKRLKPSVLTADDDEQPGKRKRSSARCNAARRQNALLSTGPKTAAGREIVARNAIQHGLSSRAIVVTGEKPEEWKAHVTAVVRSLRPVGYVEEQLAQEVAWQLWRKRRIARYESQAARNAGENATQLATAQLSAASFTAANVCSPEQLERLAVVPDNARLEKVMRAEGHYDKCLGRALRNLRELQKDRRGDSKTAKHLLRVVSQLLKDSQANLSPKPVRATVVQPAEQVPPVPLLPAFIPPAP